MTLRVSLAMLAETDSPTLGRCLSSVADLVDEIVVVTQPGATESWQDDARSFGAKLVEFPWCDHFSAARNQSLRHATGDWIFYLDADEWLDEEHRGRLRTLIGNLSAEAVAYRFHQVSVTASGPREVMRPVRLFRNIPGARWRYRIHEQILPALAGRGRLLESEIEIAHDGYASPHTLVGKRRRNLRLLALDRTERPNDPFVLYNAGIAALDARQPAEAVQLLKRARERSQGSAFGPPEEELFVALARALSLSGDQGAARAVCCEGLAALPESAMLHYVDGTLLMEQGDVAAAESRLRRSIDLRPRLGPAWQSLTDLLLKSRRHEEAQALADRLPNVSGMRIDAAICLSRVQFARHRTRDALQTLQTALTKDPKALILYELYVTVLLALGDTVRARPALETLLSLDPGKAWAARALSAIANEHSSMGGRYASSAEVQEIR